MEFDPKAGTSASEPVSGAAPEEGPGLGPGRAPRIRVGLGAGVVLVLVAAAVAVVITAASAHPAAASSSGYDSGAETAHTASPTTDDTATGSSSGTAFVQVVGQVQKPGVYELPAGDRIVDAVAAAGGFTQKADQASLNLAQVISDGEQIVVAARGAVATGGAGSTGVGSGLTASGTVDINTADATGLETLDGIGPALAQRILAYRAAHNGFRSINDLQNVTGIGPKKFAAIKGSVST